MEMKPCVGENCPVQPPQPAKSDDASQERELVAEKERFAGKVRAVIGAEKDLAASVAAAVSRMTETGSRLEGKASDDALRIALFALETLAAKGYSADDVQDEASAIAIGDALAKLDSSTKLL